MKALLLVFGLFGLLAPHDFFISICTIHHDPEEQRLEITWRITTHDLEHTLEPDAGGPLKLGTEREDPRADSLVASYLQRHLRLELHGQRLQPRYLGKEVDLETTYAYLEVDGIADPEGLTVLNTLLQDLFLEQQNIVHLETGAGTASHTFIHGSEPHTFTTPQ